MAINWIEGFIRLFLQIALHSVLNLVRYRLNLSSGRIGLWRRWSSPDKYVNQSITIWLIPFSSIWIWWKNKINSYAWYILLTLSGYFLTHNFQINKHAVIRTDSFHEKFWPLKRVEWIGQQFTKSHTKPCLTLFSSFSDQLKVFLNEKFRLLKQSQLE